MKPEISVIIPTYNEEEYIEETLKSVKNQRFDSYEVIVSDCKSDDKTRDIAGKYADKVVLSQRSTASARNTGARHARGRYLVFIDADTKLPEDYLEKAYEIFRKGEYIGFSGAFKFSNKSLKYKVVERGVNLFFIMMSLRGKTIIPGFSFCIPKSVFDKFGGFKDVFLEDVQLCQKLNKTGKTKYFTNFYVVTSSRRLEEMGIIGTLDYYCDFRQRWNEINQFSKRYVKVGGVA